MKDLDKNMIKVNCECKDFLNFSELSEFQGELKKRDDTDVDKIIKSIKKFGFSFPFFVWKNDGKNFLLDGHGRYKALEKLDSLGFLLPALPVVYVSCKDERDARDLLLRLNSSYGKMTKESVLEFIGDFEIDVSNFELPCGEIDFGANDIEPIDFGDDPSDKKKLGVLVSCETESEMEQVFQQLREMGLNCKMVE